MKCRARQCQTAVVEVYASYGDISSAPCGCVDAGVVCGVGWERVECGDSQNFDKGRNERRVGFFDN